jgi:hypothetical protein
MLINKTTIFFFIVLSVNPTSTSEKEITENVEASGNNDEAYINKYFEVVKRKVDLRKEDLIQRIHNYSAEIIKSIESAKPESLKMLHGINKLKTEVENFKNNLNEFTKNFDKNEISQKSLSVLNEVYTNLLGEYNDLFNKYSFDFKEIDIKDVFGYLSETKRVSLKNI